MADVAMTNFKTKHPVIVCGKGGNGGDGLVCARHLAMQGIPIKVFLLIGNEDLIGDPAINFGILAKGFSGFVDLHVGATLQNMDELATAIQKCDLIIDCILGTGLDQAPKGMVAQAIELINSVRVPVLACDMPSGVDGSTGNVPGIAVKADTTCTFGIPKIGHFLFPGASHVGNLILTNAGFPDVLLCDPEIPSNLMTKSEALRLIPDRHPASHKGTFGRVVIIGGSAFFPGAPILSGLGSIYTGTGLTSVIVPDCIYQSIAGRYPEMIVQASASSENGTFSEKAIEDIIRSTTRATVVVLGPGLGNSPELIQVVNEVMCKVQVPLIIDADALNILAKNSSGLLLRSENSLPTIITPHWGEAGRFGSTAFDIITNPIATALRFSVRFGSITLLKSARTIIASPNGHFYINATGNTALSKGGSGDVLSGCIASLVSQNMNCFEASALGCYLFGLAGEMASEEYGEFGVISSQVAKLIPKVIKEITDENSD